MNFVEEAKSFILVYFKNLIVIFLGLLFRFLFTSSVNLVGPIDVSN